MRMKKATAFGLAALMGSYHDPGSSGYGKRG